VYRGQSDTVICYFDANSKTEAEIDIKAVFDIDIFVNIKAF
jgi:hypothetical protein